MRILVTEKLSEAGLALLRERFQVDVRDDLAHAGLCQLRQHLLDERGKLVVIAARLFFFERVLQVFKPHHAADDLACETDIILPKRTGTFNRRDGLAFAPDDHLGLDGIGDVHAGDGFLDGGFENRGLGIGFRRVVAARDAFDLIEATAAGAAARSLAVCHSLVSQGEAPPRVLGALTWQYNLVARCVALQEGRARVDADRKICPAPATLHTRLATFVASRYDGDVTRIWNDGASFDVVQKRAQELPGFGEQKAEKLKYVLHYFGHRDFSV